MRSFAPQKLPVNEPLPAGVEIRRPTQNDSGNFYAICVAMERWIDDWADDSLVFVAVRDGELVGGIREWKTCDERTVLVDLWVREDVRGCRLGHALIRRMIDAVSAQDVYLDCVRSLEPYYAELGFETMDRSLAPDILEADELPESIVMVLNKANCHA
jgi:GNAT superfamily N-acetyltransferase